MAEWSGRLSYRANVMDVQARLVTATSNVEVTHAYASGESSSVSGAARASGRLHHSQSVGRGNGEAPCFTRLRGPGDHEPGSCEHARAPRRGQRREPERG